MDFISHLSFGEIDYNEIKGGTNKTSYFKNLGWNKWAMGLEGLLYGDIEISMSTQQPQLAFIDSSNVSIQLPYK